MTDAATNPPNALIARFDVDGPKAIETVAAEPDAIVEALVAPTTIRLLDYAEVILVESVVHLLDLQRALDVAPGVPDSGLRQVAGVVAAMVDPVELIETGCGRDGAKVNAVIR